MNVIDDFLSRVRRRLRGLWAVATLAWAAPVVAASALALVVVGRIRPWGWPERAAVAVSSVAVVVVVVAAIAIRIPERVAARAADAGLGAHDTLVTAVELDGADGLFADRVRARANALVAGADLRRALPVRVQGRRLLAGGALGVVALVAGMVANPQEEVRRQRALERERVTAAAAELEQAAAELGDRIEPETGALAVVDELEALAHALAELSDLEEANALLDAAEAGLEAGITPEALAAKAAVSGLERSLASEPLPGAARGDDATAQLAAAAAALGGLGDEDRAELADRLERLAETQAVGNAPAADALAQAAAGLRSGDVPAAGRALGLAADAHQGATAAAAAGDLRRSALGAVGEARSALKAPGNGQTGARGEGNGQGQGEGQGEGQGGGQGQGTGQGRGEGQGSGAGRGQGQAGSASGAVAGAAGGNGAGRGGTGTAVGTPGSASVGDENRTDEPSLFDPTADGQELDVRGRSTGDDLGEVVGTGNGASSRGSSFVPLSAAIESFRQRVTVALDDPALSPSMRELVRAYFDRLARGE